jgi:NAD(P)-dependent dehydrogenase (short-subunit alcohol dehydrogenase family)
MDVSELFSLEGKVALVTGGGRGIGRAVVERLRADGYEVVACDVAPSGDEVRCDVSNPDDVARVFAGIDRLDALVNNAGITVFKRLEEMTLAEWRRVIDTNLTSVFLCTQAALNALRAAGGSVVNIASTRALQSEPNAEAYAASKGGIVALTHSLAISLAPLRVNCISPGWIDVHPETPLRPEDHAQHPAGRVGRPEDVASLAAYLMSAEAGFITGANFVVDGGMTRKMIYLE